MERVHGKREGGLLPYPGTHRGHRVLSPDLGRRSHHAHPFDVPGPHQRLRKEVGQTLKASSMSRMVRLPVFALAAALVSPLGAHRLDEVLQGTLISIMPDHVILEINISPGVETVQRFLALADTSRDGLLSPGEQEMYARRVIDDIILEIDHQPTRLDLRQSMFPPVDEMRAGLGTIRFALRAQFTPVAAGPHQLYLRNNHLTAISVYQVNALVPVAGLEILEQ